jgi:AraC-like DNA-binding protein
MIGKTRQARPSKVEELFDPEVGQARGMLRRNLAAGAMRHSRRRPAADLACWIAHYWMIRWDLRGCPAYVAESLPHPNVHLIFENESAVIAGVQSHKFSRVIEGQSHVFGVKFRPGGFRPFYKFAVSSLADRLISASRVFGKDLKSLENVAVSSCGENEKVGAGDAFFRARMPKPDPAVALSSRLVDLVLKETAIKTVEDLAGRAAMSQRSLQRLFSEYVGASPKWVIRRYRLHELIEKFNCGRELDWSQLALDLGYFDQAHLINDFRSIIGYSPTEYQELISRNSVGSKG